MITHQEAFAALEELAKCQIKLKGPERLKVALDVATSSPDVGFISSFYIIGPSDSTDLELKLRVNNQRKIEVEFKKSVSHLTLDSETAFKIHQSDSTLPKHLHYEEFSMMEYRALLERNEL